jgi:hypothetical protein
MTPEEARAWFDYDNQTGVLTWARRPARCVHVGDVAGVVKSDGYRAVTWRGRSYMAHRIAWAIITGDWPIGQIDHRDGKRDNNSAENIRDVDQSTNMQNQRRAMASNASSGTLGVHFYRRTKRWRASIWVDGKNTYLGYFGSKDEASSAYLTAKRKLHAGCSI